MVARLIYLQNNVNRARILYVCNFVVTSLLFFCVNRDTANDLWLGFFVLISVSIGITRTRRLSTSANLTKQIMKQSVFINICETFMFQTSKAYKLILWQYFQFFRLSQLKKKKYIYVYMGGTSQDVKRLKEKSVIL